MRIIRYDDAGTARWGVIDAGGTVRAARRRPVHGAGPGDPVGGDVRLLAPVTRARSSASAGTTPTTRPSSATPCRRSR
ncbi:DUF2437 domain-containing protein [Nonomuraea rubra]|uniref:DUF2437 domain-containing protein n=1 Tax=Nonomuraea rubra TaxID=46180 RepID=UPI003CD0A689